MASYSCHSKSASLESEFSSTEMCVIKIGLLNPFIAEISFLNGVSVY